MKCCPWQKKMFPAEFIANLWIFAGVTTNLAQKSSRQAKFQEERRAQEWDFQSNFSEPTVELCLGWISRHDLPAYISIIIYIYIYTMYIFYVFYNIYNVYIVCLCVYIYMHVYMYYSNIHVLCRTYLCIICRYLQYIHIWSHMPVSSTTICIGPQGSPLYRSTVAGAFSGTAGAEKVVVVPLVDEQRGISQITNW